MTILDTAPHPPGGRLTGRRRPYLLALALVTAWTAMYLLTPLVQVGPGIRQLALFGHLAALVLGFGAVLTLDWFGLMWVLGRQDLFTLVRVAQVVHTPIWLGLGGLALTGGLLAPDTSAPLTVVKLVAVLAVALNGLAATKVQHRLLAARGQPLPWRLLAAAVLAATVSQAGWWTATIVGFVNSQG
jgi:hypothetical protein